MACVCHEYAFFYPHAEYTVGIRNKNGIFFLGKLNDYIRIILICDNLHELCDIFLFNFLNSK
jgi:hypothetical protein